MPRNIIIEDFHEFTERMGSTPILMENGRYIFANGAKSDGQTEHTEPPPEGLANVQHRLRYAELREQQLDRSYQDNKADIDAQLHLHMVGAAGMPTHGWEKFLNRQLLLRGYWRSRVTALKEELASVDPRVALMKRQDEAQQERLRKVRDAEYSMRDIVNRVWRELPEEEQAERIASQSGVPTFDDLAELAVRTTLPRKLIANG